MLPRTPPLALLRDEGFFKLYLDGCIIVVELTNTFAVPRINYPALTQMFEAMQQLVMDRQLQASGWCILYDFSAVTAYELTAATAFANFFRWARKNGRRQAAHILPAYTQTSEVSRAKRLVFSLMNQFASNNMDQYTAVDYSDAKRWLDSRLGGNANEAPNGKEYI